MTTQISVLKQEVRALKDSVAPRESAIVFMGGKPDEPHGVFTYQIYHLHSKLKQPYPYKKEILEFTREKYRDMIKRFPFMKAESHVWSSYDKWVESYRCKCGKHGVDGNQPHYGEGE